LGFFVAGIVLGITVPFLARRGHQLNEWVSILVIGACVALCLLPGTRRQHR
jgi:purine-cytosine permease-like protein